MDRDVYVYFKFIESSRIFKRPKRWVVVKLRRLEKTSDIDLFYQPITYNALNTCQISLFQIPRVKTDYVQFRVFTNLSGVVDVLYEIVVVVVE